MHPILNIATSAARKAGDLIIRSTERLDKLKVMEKSHNDFVTDIDEKAEAIIIETIRKAFPDHGILAEESGHSPGDDFTWIIDPLDGTRNFLHGFPQFCVSIALKHKNTMEHAVIYDPTRQEFFTASRGRGAMLNNTRMRVSKRLKLPECLIGTGFPFRHSDNRVSQYIKLLENILPICGDIRRAGAAALDLAYVAAGRLDGFFEMGLKPWDLAAGTLLITEAGGLVGDFNGDNGFMESGDIVCGNPKIFKALLQQIHPHVHEA